MSNEENGGARHPGLASLFRYPLMSAIAERRTRRISRGTSVSAAGLSHTSANAARSPDGARRSGPGGFDRLDRRDHA